jgi:hypothetical protein
MFSNPLHQLGKSSPARRWSWLAPALALVGTLLPMTGWQASAQWQNRGVAGNSSDDGENEFPGEDEGGDSSDGDLEANLPFRRSVRESLASALAGEPSAPLTGGSDQASMARAPHPGRPAAACSAARLPLRC